MEKKRECKNILVTGGAGFIGSAFIRYVLNLDDFTGNVVNYDLLTYAGSLRNVEDVQKDPRYTFIRADICEGEKLSETIDKYNIDTIVHFAAESHVDNSIRGPKVFLDTNVYGTFTLLEEVRKRPHIHFHHISTDEVYGELGSDGYFTEDSSYNPSSPYSASKAASDHFVWSYHRTYDLSITMSHCSNNFGPYQFPEKLIPVMILNCIKREKLPLYGKGQNIRDWLYVDDHADAVFKIINYAKSGETYDVGGAEEKTNISLVNEIITILSKLLNKPLESYLSLITFVKDRPGHDFRYAIDSTKIKLDLGWEPKHSFKEALEKTIHWYLKNISWMDIQEKELALT